MAINKPEEELPDEAPLTVELDPDAGVEIEVEPEAVEAQAEQDDPAKDLAQQIETLKAAQEQQAEELARTQHERNEALQYARQREHQAFNERQHRTATEGEMVQNALQAAQAEQQSATLALKSAYETGDVDQMAQANARIARSATDIRTFEQTAAQLAEQQQREQWQAQQMQRQPPPQQQPRQYSQAELLKAALANPNLLDEEKRWLEAHPEVVSNPALNRKLNTVYNKAVEHEKLTPGSQEYFSYMNREMGYAEPRGNNMAARVSAPVSRQSPGQSPSKGIKLTAQDVEIANSMGLKTPEQLKMYARNKQARQQENSRAN